MFLAAVEAQSAHRQAGLSTFKYAQIEEAKFGSKPVDPLKALRMAAACSSDRASEKAVRQNQEELARHKAMQVNIDFAHSLLLAARENNQERFDLLMGMNRRFLANRQAGIDLKIADELGNTAMHYAAYNGNITMLQQLLLAGANILSQNKKGITPCGMAIKAHSGATLFLANQLGKELLKAAFDLNNERSLLILRTGQVNLNIVDIQRRSPLMLSAIANNVFLVRELLQYGADERQRDRDGNTALILAALNGCEEAVNELSRGDAASLLIKSGKGLRPYEIAREIRNDKMAKTISRMEHKHLLVLLTSKRDDLAMDFVNLPEVEVNGTSSDGTTALMIAARNDKISHAIQLLVRGADLNAHNKRGQSAFDLAYRTGNLHLADLLKYDGADTGN